ncbi:MAG: hypothetical protein ACOC56_03160 [Atribacterota bacterium]
MKFKTKAELIDEHEPSESTTHNVAWIGFDGYRDGVDEAFKNFKERIDFYKKYKNSMEEFSDEYQSLYKEMCMKIKGRVQTECAFSHYDKEKYRDWLFDYCFGDVIE